MSKFIAQHTNSEGERIGIAVVESGPFEGRTLLVICDDERPGRATALAPMLLDEGTRAWLKSQLEILE